MIDKTLNILESYFKDDGIVYIVEDTKDNISNFKIVIKLISIESIHKNLMLKVYDILTLPMAMDKCIDKRFELPNKLIALGVLVSKVEPNFGLDTDEFGKYKDCGLSIEFKVIN